MNRKKLVPIGTAIVLILTTVLIYVFWYTEYVGGTVLSAIASVAVLVFSFIYMLAEHQRGRVRTMTIILTVVALALTAMDTIPVFYRTSGDSGFLYLVAVGFATVALLVQAFVPRDAPVGEIETPD